MQTFSMHEVTAPYAIGPVLMLHYAIEVKCYFRGERSLMFRPDMRGSSAAVATEDEDNI